jgi:2'-5' RNA ligase
VPKQRLAVALLLPDAVAAEVDGLRRALGADLDMVPPHVTLVPPVNVRDDALADALAVLRAAASAVTPAPLRLDLGPPTTFHPVTPVVYLAVGGDLASLAELRDRVFTPPLARPIGFDFVPHVTLNEDMDPERIPAAVAALADFPASVEIDRVHVLRETPGRLWRPVADAPFVTPAVVGRGGLPTELTVTDLVDPIAARVLPAGGGEGGALDAFDLLDPLDLPAGDPWAITARRDGEVLGVAHGRVVGDRLDVDALVVAPEHRRQGVGRHLRAQVEALAAGRSLAEIRWPG